MPKDCTGILGTQFDTCGVSSGHQVKPLGGTQRTWVCIKPWSACKQQSPCLSALRAKIEAVMNSSSAQDVMNRKRRLVTKPGLL